MNGIQFKALLSAASTPTVNLLDPATAAAQLGTDAATVLAWRDGRERVPDEVVTRLRTLIALLVGPAPERKD